MDDLLQKWGSTREQPRPKNMEKGERSHPVGMRLT